MTKITFFQTPTVEDSLALTRFKELVVENTSLSILEEKEEAKGAKADLVSAIDILNLTLSTISTLITVIDFWQSQYPKYSIKIDIEGNTYTKENMSKGEFEETLKKALEKQEQVTLKIKSEEK